MRVTVVGGGVSGLTCGVRLLESGARVRIVTGEPAPRTTSAVAGAVWFPYRVQPNERTGPWGAIGYERFERLAGDERAPVSMVEMTILYWEPLAEQPWWVSALPRESGVREAAASELPDGFSAGRVVRVPCIVAPAYLDWLARRFAELGGTVEVGEVAALEHVDGDVVVNCAGVGARALAGDSDLKPVRGQVAYVRPRRPTRFLIDETSPYSLAYVLPRPDLTVLGGTAEEDDGDLSVRADTTRSIIERTQRLDPSLADASFVGAAVGLRPARSEVRLERELMPDGRPVVHDYGHGGSGFTLSWGCADEVARLALDAG